jgi:hypothetical protein
MTFNPEAQNFAPFENPAGVGDDDHGDELGPTSLTPSRPAANRGRGGPLIRVLRGKGNIRGIGLRRGGAPGTIYTPASLAAVSQGSEELPRAPAQSGTTQYNDRNHGLEVQRGSFRSSSAAPGISSPHVSRPTSRTSMAPYVIPHNPMAPLQRAAPSQQLSIPSGMDPDKTIPVIRSRDENEAELPPAKRGKAHIDGLVSLENTDRILKTALASESKRGDNLELELKNKTKEIKQLHEKTAALEEQIGSLTSHLLGVQGTIDTFLTKAQDGNPDAIKARRAFFAVSFPPHTLQKVLNQ